MTCGGGYSTISNTTIKPCFTGTYAVPEEDPSTMALKHAKPAHRIQPPTSAERDHKPANVYVDKPDHTLIAERQQISISLECGPGATYAAELRARRRAIDDVLAARARNIDAARSRVRAIEARVASERDAETTPWNPRYVAYAREHNRTPDDMLAHDRERFPGGVMAGFVLWISDRWKLWDLRHEHGANHVRDQAEHDAFTAWIGGAS